ncbi:deoxyribodipyrimidine photo-lyase [Gilvimarinus agarilyticus]|uniref:deoxyribodipyrimidine photo-lyase n=1 Tax=Gilvimarinus sp. 2_MG-2023 TaxID=3062666 RepID=UPI001C089E39|nr:deoxyribodipyrimidine photo-lyase [Gilvimarinus sp. 2_MG-2023]MBU2887138.1 deoxyribodipyrimidine photo-lyase [Gilvimarinus agarilyticus]MDO6571797.1 deoxyribodipyrimidine photo-lyase [Gilvimarinus sp. 2_MG-2023]
MNRLIWFRNDLRLIDNPALHHCLDDKTTGTDDAPVSALFILCQEYIDTHPIGAKRLRFMQEALLNLAQGLAKQGIELRTEYVEKKADIAQRVVDVCSHVGARVVFCNREYPLDERRRDQDCKALCEEQGITFNAYHDRCLIPPGALKTQAGDHYKVFTPFARAWRKLADASQFQIYSAPKSKIQAVAAPSDTINRLFSRAGADCQPVLWQADEHSALDALQDFIEQHLADYDEERDYPALQATSKLSPYLSVGLLSPKQCYIACRHAVGVSENVGAHTWINELIWREFYMHIAAIYPKVSMHRPLQAYTECIPWRQNETDFQRWCQGETGIPIIDAAMRQLNQTGWMHNRLRMIVAMFLSKNLLIDWRKGEAYFMSQLIDGDFSANNGGWQWSASTGTDAAPYFRIMNPLTQSERYDPQGHFIRQWLPELAAVKGKNIHNPGPINGYPAPMVDVKATRKEAIAVFKACKEQYAKESHEH